jgi:ATP-dependent Clp protease adaptor protein ClpS
MSDDDKYGVSLEDEIKHAGNTVLDRPPLEERNDLRRPPLWQVVIHNDDFTPMDFVVALLITIFQKSEQEATLIMLDIHQKGKGVGGIYPKDIADMRVCQVKAFAEGREHPLLATMEEVPD